MSICMWILTLKGLIKQQGTGNKLVGTHAETIANSVPGWVVAC